MKAQSEIDAHRARAAELKAELETTELFLREELSKELHERLATALEMVKSIKKEFAELGIPLPKRTYMKKVKGEGQ